jgi:serine/threonine protein kinase
MSEKDEAEDSCLRLSTEQRVDAACLRFETEWQAGRQPRIETYLEGVPEPERSALLRELLALELHYRREDGQEPQWEEYGVRFPVHLEVIRAVWAGPADSSFPESSVDSSPSRAPTTGNGYATSVDHLVPTISGFEILGTIGKGNMGVVYKARQPSLKRFVALKLIRPGNQTRPWALNRFRVEAEAVARLGHPNIVQVYQVGHDGGVPWIALEFVDGINLAQRLKRGRVPVETGADLVRTLARAMHAAHEKGIVHRDLKPENVLLTKDRVPKVVDFGLARLLDQDDAQTGTGTVLGTPRYMAPEQASGQSLEAGPAADVYALGAILYELLTGLPPFRSGTAERTLELVRTREPERPRALSRRVDAELEAVCLTCLEKSPARRYKSALALAEDLEQWLSGRRTKARPRGRLDRVRRSFRRHALACMVIALVALVVLGGCVWRYMTDPAREPSASASELFAGQPVTLVDESGHTRVDETRTHRDELRVRVAENGAFAVETFGFAAVEFLSEVPVSSYRFCAEVRQDRGVIGAGKFAEVGLYFGYRSEVPGEGETTHCFLSLRFCNRRPPGLVKSEKCSIALHIARLPGK